MSQRAGWYRRKPTSARGRCVCGTWCAQLKGGALYCPKCDLWFRNQDRVVDAFGAQGVGR